MIEENENKYNTIDAILFQEGDLLYGTNAARGKYVDETDSKLEFTLLRFKPFSEISPGPHSLPRIIDIYHDVIFNPEFFDIDCSSGMEPYIDVLKEYKEFLGKETDICSMCLRRIDFFSQAYKIHFLLDGYDPSRNLITSKEIKYVIQNKDRLKDSVIFYDKIDGKLRPVDYKYAEEKTKNNPNSSGPRKKKILLFSPPFYGHLNVLKEFVKEFRDNYELAMVIPGWTNILPNLKGISYESIVLGNSSLKETDPALWTFPRVYELLESSLKLTEWFHPDLIPEFNGFFSY